MDDVFEKIYVPVVNSVSVQSGTSNLPAGSSVLTLYKSKLCYYISLSELWFHQIGFRALIYFNTSALQGNLSRLDILHTNIFK